MITASVKERCSFVYSLSMSELCRGIYLVDWPLKAHLMQAVVNTLLLG